MFQRTYYFLKNNLQKLFATIIKDKKSKFTSIQKSIIKSAYDLIDKSNDVMDDPDTEKCKATYLDEDLMPLLNEELLSLFHLNILSLPY